ncbi:MAG: protein kinase [Planctomycetota bacterium]
MNEAREEPRGAIDATPRGLDEDPSRDELPEAGTSGEESSEGAAAGAAQDDRTATEAPPAEGVAGEETVTEMVPSSLSEPVALSTSDALDAADPSLATASSSPSSPASIGGEEPPASSSQVAAPQAELRPGDRFLSYRIEGELARGGMGVVYRALHVGLRREVALKTLAAGTLADEEQRRRFLREARAAAALDHPYVVSVLEVGRSEGIDFFAMPLVGGRPLGAVWRAHELSRGERLRLFVRICEGVEHAHVRGVVHRDLKPEGVLVTPDGAPHILDFGVARQVDEVLDLLEGSQDAALTGSLLYMAPEAASRSRPSDVRSDVYSLGAILYEALAGRPPYQGSFREVSAQLQEGEPPPPSAHARGVPRELDAICLRALALEPEERYQSVLELRRDVERHLAGEVVRAYPGGPLHRLVRMVRRNPASAAATALGVLSLVVALVLAMRAARAAERELAAQVLRDASEGWVALGGSRPADAAAAFERARTRLGERVLEVDQDLTALVAPDERAHLLTGDRLLRWRERANGEQRRVQAGELLRAAREALGRGELDRAAREVEAAAVLGSGGEAVREELCTALVLRGRASLAAGGAGAPSPPTEAALRAAEGAAQRALRLDPAHAAARKLLGDALAGLATLAGEERRQALAKERRARAQALLGQAEQARQAGDLDLASSRFLASLELEPSPAAREGLGAVERARAERARAAEQAEAERLAEAGRARLRERASAATTAGRAARVEAQQRFAAGELPERVRERYWEALERLRLAEDLSREDAAGARALREELQGAAREFAAVLIEQGHPELARFIRRVGGLSPDDDREVELPRDRYCGLVETAAVEARRAFGTVVVFEPGTGLDLIRGWLHQELGERRRIYVEVSVLSDIDKSGPHPVLLLTGLAVRLHDKDRGTVSPPRRLDLERPCLRPAKVDGLGRRRIPPFERSQGLPADDLLPRLVKLIQELVREAR